MGFETVGNEKLRVDQTFGLPLKSPISAPINNMPYVGERFLHKGGLLAPSEEPENI